MPRVGHESWAAPRRVHVARNSIVSDELHVLRLEGDVEETLSGLWVFHYKDTTVYRQQL